MNRNEREQARRIGAFVDGLVLHHRSESAPADAVAPQDREFQDLRDLAQRLGELEVLPPAGFREQLAERIRESCDCDPADTEPAPRLPWRAGRARPTGIPRPALRIAMLTVAVTAGILVLTRTVIDVPVVSAQTILSRSDAALTGLVRPGQLLYRRWRVTSSGTNRQGQPTPPSERIIEEWMDGDDFERVAGRWYAADNRLRIAYTTVTQGNEYRPNVYFSPGVFNEPRGLLNVEPTRREFEAALGRFPPATRRALRVYLDRHYIYAPIAGERTFNRAIVEPPAYETPAVPRILVSFDDSHTLNGKRVYRVRLVDSASVTFNWRSSGPPLVRLAQAEIVRYIEHDSYLSVKTEERYVYEDGRRRFITRQLASTQALERAALGDDPFVIDMPPGTPVQRQSAYELLSGVSRVLERVPTFSSRLAPLPDLAPQ